MEIQTQLADRRMKSMRSTKQSILCITTLVFITALFGAKCLLATDITFSDEMSYIATALRFVKGDAMLVDDWAPMQLNSFLLLPLVRCYYLILVQWRESYSGFVLSIC